MEVMNFEDVAVAENNSKIKSISALLYVLQEMLQSMLEEVDRTYELHKAGASTSLLTQLEEVLKNPSSSLFSMSAKIDGQVKSLVDKSVKSFLTKQEGLVVSAGRSKTSMNDLHYSIALAKDDEDSRAAIFEFLDKYDLLDISVRYPVYFQFVPVELMPKIKIEENIVPKQAA